MICQTFPILTLLILLSGATIENGLGQRIQAPKGSFLDLVGDLGFHRSREPTFPALNCRPPVQVGHGSGPEWHNQYTRFSGELGLVQRNTRLGQAPS